MLKFIEENVTVQNRNLKFKSLKILCEHNGILIKHY